MEKTTPKEFNQEAFDSFKSPMLEDLTIEELDDLYQNLCYSSASKEEKDQVLNEIKARKHGVSQE